MEVEIRVAASISSDTKLGWPLVSVVILNYNGIGVLLNCLRSVFSSDYPSLQVIVVDNGSMDGSADVAKKEFPQIILVSNGRNLGYCEGNNVGIREARGEYIVLLNNDVFVTEGWLKALLEACSRHVEAGFFQPKILLADRLRIINSAGNTIHFAGFGLCRGMGESDLGQFDDETRIGFCSGACLLVRRRALEDVGLLDPAYFAFNEDTDLGWRAALRGWSSIYVPSSVVHHRLGYSWGSTLSHRKFYLLERNRELTILKNYSSRSLIILLPLLIFFELSVIGFATARGLLKEKVRSYVDAFRLRRHLTIQRDFMQKRRRISDRTVAASFLLRVDHSYIGEMAKPLNRIMCFLGDWLVSHI